MILRSFDGIQIKDLCIVFLSVYYHKKVNIDMKKEIKFFIDSAYAGKSKCAALPLF